MRARKVGKGESHSHPHHVDIQVGSCICLNVFMLNHYMCAYVGSNPCRKLSLLGIAHPIEGTLFQVHGLFGKTALTRGRFSEESRIVALIFFFFCKTCIRILNFNICCIKSDVINSSTVGI